MAGLIDLVKMHLSEIKQGNADAFERELQERYIVLDDSTVREVGRLLANDPIGMQLVKCSLFEYHLRAFPNQPERAEEYFRLVRIYKGENEDS